MIIAAFALFAFGAICFGQAFAARRAGAHRAAVVVFRPGFRDYVPQPSLDVAEDIRPDTVPSASESETSTHHTDWTSRIKWSLRLPLTIITTRRKTVETSVPKAYNAIAEPVFAGSPITLAASIPVLETPYSPELAPRKRAMFDKLFRRGKTSRDAADLMNDLNTNQSSSADAEHTFAAADIREKMSVTLGALDSPTILSSPSNEAIIEDEDEETEEREAFTIPQSRRTELEASAIAKHREYEKTERAASEIAARQPAPVVVMPNVVDDVSTLAEASAPSEPDVQRANSRWAMDATGSATPVALEQRRRLMNYLLSIQAEDPSARETLSRIAHEDAELATAARRALDEVA